MPPLLTIPLLVFVGYRLYGWLLRFLALVIWRPSGVRGVLVYSESPNWQDYIESNWLPRTANRLTVLNWSDRQDWTKTLAVRLFRYYVGTVSNFNPSVVLSQGLRWPLVFRCFHAFRDAKHENWEALRGIEQRLFDELD